MPASVLYIRTTSHLLAGRLGGGIEVPVPHDGVALLVKVPEEDPVEHPVEEEDAAHPDWEAAGGMDEGYQGVAEDK